MEFTTVGTRLASAVAGPLVKKLFVTEGAGAGVVDKPIRISGYVSFKGEKRTLTKSDVHDLAAKLVKQALRTGERPIPADEQQAVVVALTTTLHALGDLTITDLDAVRLGAEDFARELRRASGRPERGLSADATYFYEHLVVTASLHILHFFTQRSTFVAHALVEQTHEVAKLTAKVDELIRRSPLPGGEDAAFEREYLPYMARKFGTLTIYGIDLANSPNRWPLDAAYLSLGVSASPWRDTLRRWARRTRSHISSDDVSFGIMVGDSPISESDAHSPRHGNHFVIFAPELSNSEYHTSERLTRELVRQTILTQASDAKLTMASSLWDAASALRELAADQVLAGAPRVLLRGEAGSGKTTLVQWLAVTAARSELSADMAYLYDRVPFVLPLRALTRHGGPFPAPKDFLGATGCPLAGTQPAGWENRVLAAGRGLILIDGVDEVPARERERTRRWLRDLIEAYDGDNRWLVTSRPSAVDDNWLDEDGFEELTLSTMNPAAVATFIKRWHNAARADDTDDDLGAYEVQLLEAVRTKPDLGRLATNPLMCGLICALHRDRRGYLPRGRKDLYEAALSMLLTRRDRERDVQGPELREEPQLDLLQQLAYHLIKNGRTEMDRPRAEEIITRALPAIPEAAALGDARAVFAYFLHRSGLLREPIPGAVDFIHRTFQDFLGARAAVEEGDFGLLTEHAADDQWEDVIRLAVALARPRERVTIFKDLIARGDHASDGRTRARIYLLAAACLEHATSLEPAVRAVVEERTARLIPPTSPSEALALAEVGPLILDLLSGPEDLSDNDRSAVLVVMAASHVTSEAAISFLARFAPYPSAAVRLELLRAWSRFDSTVYADEVIARLDPQGLRYIIQSDDQLRHLTRLGLNPSALDIQSGVSTDELRRYLDRHPVTEIALSIPVTDLKLLAGQTGLRRLAIDDYPELTNLSAIEGLPLTHLHITTARSDLDLRPVAHLPQLEILMIRGPSDLRWSSEILPADAPLQNMAMHGVRPACDLAGLGAFHRLKSLVLYSPSAPSSADDWQEILGLPALSELAVSAASLETLPAGIVLSQVTSLSLESGGDRAVQSAIHRAPVAFPQLTTIIFNGDMRAESDIDIAPLAELPHLQSLAIAISRDRVQGTAALAPSVVMLLK